ncbi:helix-turn-helix domain-containing protein [Pseudomonas sp. GX19020]|uniref:helix-turn-helix transcriptional regulator n=1 Tax=Pseudomonas sp. GX19020 TaxID=2942277 RepID=UPI002019A2F3|nr:helix-turn-helix transcriptional regulator [Pseudomonas sp. GX19020]MCL4065812.1 helix-turn-helix domain-containing protein [Pseudomonas sp. GX19020]
MDTIVNSAETRIARSLLQEREARNWSLAELADRAGVSKAAISKIERGLVSPTAGVLIRLAMAFDLTLAGLLLKAESRSWVQRNSDAPVWTDPQTGYSRKQIYCHPEHPIEIVEVTLPKGQSVSMPAESYLRIRQVVTVREGWLRLTEGLHQHDLTTGDSIGFGPPAEVKFSNPGEVPCLYTVHLSRS